MANVSPVRAITISKEANLTEAQLRRIEESSGGAELRLCDSTTVTEIAPRGEILAGMAKAIPISLFRAPDTLRWVNLLHAGAERILCPELVDSDIVVTCAKGAHAIPISEHAFAFMLAHVKQLPALRDSQMRRAWERRPLGELWGKTVCVVGLGNIGGEIARRAEFFGMRVVGTRRSGAPVPHVERVVTPDRLAELLPEADFVLLTLPSTSQTEGMIGAREIGQMKRGAVLINLGRGSCLDHDALIAALKSGHLGGAGLDATDPEPLPPESELWQMANVIITPHNSGSSPGSRDRAVTMFCENLIRYRNGETLRQLVDKRMGY